jgi:hypothetical protein
MKQGPSPNLQLGGGPVTVKEASGEEPAGHGVHLPVNHIAGPIGGWIVEGQQEKLGLGDQLWGGFEGRTRDRYSSLFQQSLALRSKVSFVLGSIDRPDLVFDIWEARFQAFTTIADLQKGV